MTITAPEPTNTGTPVIPKISSVDDHVAYPPHVWQT